MQACLFADRFELSGGAREGRLVTELPARDSRTGAPCVLWLPHEVLAESLQARMRFLACARAAASIPGLMPIVDAADDERLYVAVPPARRPAFPLTALLDRRGGLANIALRLARALAAALDRAHAAGLVHGFLGVEDVWSFGGRLVVSGVGLWHSLDREAVIRAFGPLATIAPEVRGGAEPTARSDVYALAALCARLVGGGAGVGISVTTATDARVVLALAPALSPHPRDRPPTCLDLAADLEDALIASTARSPRAVAPLPRGYDAPTWPTQRASP